MIVARGEMTVSGFPQRRSSYCSQVIMIDGPLVVLSIKHNLAHIVCVTLPVASGVGDVYCHVSRLSIIT